MGERSGIAVQPGTPDGRAASRRRVLAAATTCDAVFFCVLRYRFRTLWASVLAHGFNNTIGLAAYFLFGPFTGLW